VSHEAYFAAQRFRRVDVTCEDLTALIANYLAGELDPETTLAFEEHLHGCSGCIPFLKTYRKTMRNEDIPSEMQDRVQRFLDSRLRDQCSRQIRQSFVACRGDHRRELAIAAWLILNAKMRESVRPQENSLHPFPLCFVQSM
jgi:anti-sigma factor RsiW